MNRKHISFTILLILITLISISSIQAANQTDVIESTDTNPLTEISFNGTTSDDLQKTIDKASDGETINLGENKAYNLNSTVEITKPVTLKGTNVSITSQNALSIRQTSNVEINGIKFINTNPLPGYAESIKGTGIYIQGLTNIIIDNCSFINYAHGVDMYTSSDSVVKNSYFTGTTTGVNPERADAGTKALQIMGSHNVKALNNTFEGNILDGLSIASSSYDIYAENNTFINNTYAIFYGGASTQGNILKNNRFITCGMINTSYTDNLGKVVVCYQNLPVISLQKASSYIQIIDNEFVVKNSNVLILSEAENRAHGFPSVIGAINITGNTVKKYDASVDDSSVTFYYINVLENLGISPVGEIDVYGNNFTDIPGIVNFKLNFNEIKDSNNTVHIPKTQTNTFLTVTYVKGGRIVLELDDLAGSGIEGEKITYSINGGSDITDETDMYGHVYINGLSGEVKLKAKFKGSDKYSECDLTTTIQVSPVQTATSIAAGSLTVNVISAKGTSYKFTLKDATGKAIADKQVSITFDGKIYTATSNTNGIVSFALPAAAAGKYAVTMAFSGDSTYKGSVATSTISIVKQATKLTVAKKTFKKKATKKVTAVLKENTGKVLSGKKVTMKVNGKTYTAKTNSKGVATFKVKLTKKGTFKATTKFAGDNYYTAKSTTSKIVVK